VSQARSAAPVPAWLERSAAVGWRVLAIAGMTLVAVAMALAVPVSATAVMISLVLAATLAPTAVRLRGRGLPSSAAAAVAFGVGAVIVIGTLIILALALVPEVQRIITAVQSGLDAVRDRLASLGAPDAISSVVDIFSASIRASLTPDPAGLASAAVDVGMLLVLGTFLTYFLLADGDAGWAVAMRRLQPWQAQAVTADALAGLERVAWYVRRTALLAIADAAVTFAVLAAFGAPLPAALSAVALVAGFVPYAGAIVGGAVIFLATLAMAGTVPAIAVVLATLLAWLVAGRLLERTSMDRRADVNPVIVLIAIPAGFAMLGLVGVLALLPMTVFGLAVFRAVVAALGVAPSSAPAASPPQPDAVVTARRPDAATTEAEASDPPSRPSTAVQVRADGIPLWLDRLAQWSWRGLVIAGLGLLVIFTIDRIPSVVAPVALGLVVAATMLPVVDLLERRGWRRGVAAGLSMVVVSVVTVVVCAAAAAVTVKGLGDIIDAAAAGAGRFDLTWLRDVVLRLGSVVRVDVAAALASMAGLVLDIVLALLLCFFLLRDGPSWWQGASGRLADGRREPVQAAGHRAVGILAGYMGGTALISLFGALTSGLIMVILGLPLALPIVVIGFFFGFIPYLGSFLTTGIAVLVTFALGTPGDMVVMLVFTVVFNIVQGNIVTPIVYGRGLALHPAVVLMAIPVGGELAGMLGMFLVVPVAAVAAATWQLVPRAIDGAGLPDDEAAQDAEPDVLPATEQTAAR